MEDIFCNQDYVSLILAFEPTGRNINRTFRSSSDEWLKLELERRFPMIDDPKYLVPFFLDLLMFEDEPLNILLFDMLVSKYQSLYIVYDANTYTVPGNLKTMHYTIPEYALDICYHHKKDNLGLYLCQRYPEIIHTGVGSFYYLSICNMLQLKKTFNPNICNLTYFNVFRNPTTELLLFLKSLQGRIYKHVFLLMQGKECEPDDNNILKIFNKSTRFIDIRFIDILVHLEPQEDYTQFIESFPHVNKLMYRASVIDNYKSNIFHALLLFLNPSDWIEKFHSDLSEEEMELYVGTGSVLAARKYYLHMK